MAKQLQQVNPSSGMALMTIEQVAEMLQTSTRTVYRRSQDGTLPAPLKIGNVTRWRRDILESWIEGGCQTVCTAKSDS